jgi:hypothetical protein
LFQSSCGQARYERWEGEGREGEGREGERRGGEGEGKGGRRTNLKCRKHTGRIFNDFSLANSRTTEHTLPLWRKTLKKITGLIFFKKIRLWLPLKKKFENFKKNLNFQKLIFF